MDATSRKILHYLDSSDNDLRLASLRVLSELGHLKGKNLKAVDRLLAEDDNGLYDKILDVLILKPNRDLLNYYVPFLKSEVEPVREKSLAALECLGSSASHSIQSKFDESDYRTKQSFISLLARIPSRSNFEFLCEIILEEPIELKKQVCQAVERFKGKYTDKDKKLFESVIRDHIRIADKHKNVPAQVSFMILVGELGLKSSLNLLLRFADPKHPAEIRKYALSGLSKISLTGKVDISVQRALLSMLSEHDYPNIVQNVLKILEQFTTSKQFEKIYLELMTTNPHNPVKNFALGRLAALNSKVALEKLTSQMMSGDSFLYEKAQKILEQSPQGIQYVMKRLDNISNPEAAEKVGALLSIDRNRIKPAQISELFKKVEKNVIESGEKARIYFALIRKINPDMAFDLLMKRAQFYKLKKKYNHARLLINLLQGSLLLTTEAKFQLAVMQLKCSKKDASAEARAQEPALLQIQSLIPYKNFGLLDRLKTDKCLSPDDLCYLGNHFSEKLFDQKDFGINLLKYVLIKYPKSTSGKKAKKRLSALGVTSLTLPKKRK